MVDSVNNNGPVSSLLRAQSSTLISLNNAQQTAQKLFDQLANGAKPSTVQPGTKTAGASNGEKLPRGSLFDIFA